MADHNNPLKQLEALGQSIWLDSIRRGHILSGELQELIDAGVSGETANPTIFEKAISGSADYDETIQTMAGQGKSSVDIYENIAISDVRMACDAFRPVYDRTNAADGYVSIEVSPHLAYDTQGTIDEAKRFFREVNRPNVMIKIPGTAEGVPAIEECLYSGLNVNVTLLFAADAYEAIAWAYVRALERRAAEGKPVDRIASVASFFISRIDTLADKLIAAKLSESHDPVLTSPLEGLVSKVAIANAKEAYQRFKVIFGHPRFRALQEQAGARVQRPLWASTSTKNPKLPDTLYVDTLVGPHTVNTLPLDTIAAYRDHGQPRLTIEEDLDGMQGVFRTLSEAGISLEAITNQVLKEGVVKFEESLDKLLSVIETKRQAIVAAQNRRYDANLAALQGTIDAALDAADKNHVAARVWQKDAALWKSDPVHQAIIRNSLGWLTVAHKMQSQVADLIQFGREIKAAGFEDAVLCGMGGSSLCVEVFRRTLGGGPGYPELTVLDTTDPVTILQLEKELDLSQTLFLIASKSGGTVETLDHCKYFYARVQALKGDQAGENFVAITDPGSSLAELAQASHFRRTFLNPADIGGRYSALSYFGLVPAAVIGIDIGEVLDQAVKMTEACAASIPARDNAGAWLGVLLGTLALEGRDKVTLITSPGLDSFGLWAEQLIAESTGKEGKGLVPVAGEPVGAPKAYGADRVFVYLRLESDKNAALDKKVDALVRTGQPVLRVRMEDLVTIGAEFFRWEFAVAVAGALLGIDAFDQPNVQESKDNTKRVLQSYAADGRLGAPAPAWENAKFAVSWAGQPQPAKSLRENLAAFFKLRRPGDYVALMAYLEQTPESDAAFARIRTVTRDALKLATTLGYGPRFLHSTGQLHKGGRNNALAVQITADETVDAPIPGESYSFGVLKQAQAIGDWQALETHERRALHIHVKRGAKLDDVVAAVQAALQPDKAAPKRAVATRAKTAAKKSPAAKKTGATKRTAVTKKSKTGKPAHPVAKRARPAKKSVRRR